MKTVSFYLDFVSPYTWLALEQAESFAARHGVPFDLQPVVYAALLDAHGLVGPVETAAKRCYTLHDVARSAGALGLAIVGPPAHPFRSLEALRTLVLFRRERHALALAVGLARAAWGEGRALTDEAVLADVVTRSGLNARCLPRAIAAEEVKAALRESTAAAIAAGVFGVPTFAVDGELFWGHDRMEALGRRLGGEPPPRREVVEAMIGRPAGVERRR